MFMEDVDTINYSVPPLFLSFNSTSPCNMFSSLPVAIVRQMIYLGPSFIRQLTVYEAIMMHLICIITEKLHKYNMLHIMIEQLLDLIIFLVAWNRP